MGVLAAILNLPWTIAGILAAFISLPRGVKFITHPFAIAIYVKSFWWKPKGVRAATSGQTVILGPNIYDKDLEHELIHVDQYRREPFVHPFLYLYENHKNGYRKNKYEDEAYRLAGNKYEE